MSSRTCSIQRLPCVPVTFLFSPTNVSRDFAVSSFFPLNRTSVLSINNPCEMAKSHTCFVANEGQNAGLYAEALMRLPLFFGKPSRDP